MSIRPLLERLVRYLRPPRVIYDRVGEQPYLSRYYLTGRPTMPDGSDPFDAYGNPREGIIWNEKKWGFSLFLHKFHKGDDGPDSHCHPWKWAVSLILAGGYSEERFHKRTFGWTASRESVMPWAINVIREEDFHRVDLLEEDCWTLFLAGPKIKSWGFLDRATGAYLPWQEYIDKVRSAQGGDL